MLEKTTYPVEFWIRLHVSVWVWLTSHASSNMSPNYCHQNAVLWSNIFQLISTIFCSKQRCFLFFCWIWIWKMHFSYAEESTYATQHVRIHRAREVVASTDSKVTFPGSYLPPQKEKSNNHLELWYNDTTIHVFTLKTFYFFDWKISSLFLPHLWCFFLRQICVFIGSLNQLCLTTKPSGAVKSCELPWAGQAAPFSSSNLPIVFCWWLLTSLKWNGSLLKETYRTLLINRTKIGRIGTEHVNNVAMYFRFRGKAFSRFLPKNTPQKEGNPSIVNLPLVFSGGVMFYWLPWKLEKTYYTNTWVLKMMGIGKGKLKFELLDYSFTSLLHITYVGIWCICVKFHLIHLCDEEILAKLSDGFRSAFLLSQMFMVCWIYVVKF